MKRRKKIAAITWQSHGNHMAITWQSRGNHMATTWQPHGNHMATTWQPHGNRMAGHMKRRKKTAATMGSGRGATMGSSWGGNHGIRLGGQPWDPARERAKAWSAGSEWVRVRLRGGASVGASVFPTRTIATPTPKRCPLALRMCANGCFAPPTARMQASPPPRRPSWPNRAPTAARTAASRRRSCGGQLSSACKTTHT